MATSGPATSLDDFSPFLWGPNGFNMLRRNLEGGIDSLKYMLEFWHRYAELERQYAKGLRSLANMAFTASENAGSGFLAKLMGHSEEAKSGEALLKDVGTLSDSWESLRQQLTKLSQQHVNMASRVVAQVEDPLRGCVDATHRHGVYASGNGLIAGLEKRRELGERLKDRYYRACRAAEEAQSHYDREKLLPDNVEKTTKSLHLLSAAKQAAQTAEAEYRAAIDELRQFQTAYYAENMPSILQDLKHLEENRINVVQLSLANYLSIVASLPEVVSDICQELTTSVSSIRKQAGIKEITAKYIRMSSWSPGEVLEMKPPSLPVVVSWDEHKSAAATNSKKPRTSSLLSSLTKKTQGPHSSSSPSPSPSPTPTPSSSSSSSSSPASAPSQVTPASKQQSTPSVPCSSPSPVAASPQVIETPGGSQVETEALPDTPIPEPPPRSKTKGVPQSPPAADPPSTASPTATPSEVAPSPPAPPAAAQAPSPVPSRPETAPSQHQRTSEPALVAGEPVAAPIPAPPTVSALPEPAVAAPPPESTPTPTPFSDEQIFSEASSPLSVFDDRPGEATTTFTSSLFDDTEQTNTSSSSSIKNDADIFAPLDRARHPADTTDFFGQTGLDDLFGTAPQSRGTGGREEEDKVVAALVMANSPLNPSKAQQSSEPEAAVVPSPIPAEPIALAQPAAPDIFTATESVDEIDDSLFGEVKPTLKAAPPSSEATAFLDFLSGLAEDSSPQAQTRNSDDIFSFFDPSPRNTQQTSNPTTAQTPAQVTKAKPNIKDLDIFGGK